MDTGRIVSPVRALTTRRVAQLALLVAAATALALILIENPAAPIARILISWDAGVLTFLAATFWLLRKATPEDMARHAARAEGGRHFVLWISLVAVVVSIAVIGFEVRAMSMEPSRMQNVRVAFVLATVALSWLFVHTSFALHYAFEYYGRDPGETKVRGGLALPDERQPDFWDVWHFAIVIGVTSATADVNITSRTIRRIVSIHGITAFLFNTIILATTINFAAELFQPRVR
jgi:uncharacterized membrane protein